MIGTLVTDLLEESTRRIAAAGLTSLADVHQAPALIAFTPAMDEENLTLKRFLRKRLYRHERVVRETDQGRRIIAELFRAFQSEPRLLPPQYQAAVAAEGPRAIADYIAGMTDRYAASEHRRLFALSGG
jgi:dGTPase